MSDNNRSDERIEDVRNPNINWTSFLYKYLKDLIALFLILTSIAILVFKSGLSERVETILISLISGAVGYIFGKKVE